MGTTIFQFVIWGGISSDIRSEIMFYGSANASPYNKISDRISDDIPPQMTNLNTVNPQIINQFLSGCVYFKDFANGINYVQGSDNELKSAGL